MVGMEKVHNFLHLPSFVMILSGVLQASLNFLCVAPVAADWIWTVSSIYPLSAIIPGVYHPPFFFPY